jgi:hypothetical protein
MIMAGCAIMKAASDKVPGEVPHKMLVLEDAEGRTTDIMAPKGAPDFLKWKSKKIGVIWANAEHAIVIFDYFDYERGIEDCWGFGLVAHDKDGKIENDGVNFFVGHVIKDGDQILKQEWYLIEKIEGKNRLIKCGLNDIRLKIQAMVMVWKMNEKPEGKKLEV